MLYLVGEIYFNVFFEPCNFLEMSVPLMVDESTAK